MFLSRRTRLATLLVALALAPALVAEVDGNEGVIGLNEGEIEVAPLPVRARNERGEVHQGLARGRTEAHALGSVIDAAQSEQGVRLAAKLKGQPGDRYAIVAAVLVLDQDGGRKPVNFTVVAKGQLDGCGEALLKGEVPIDMETLAKLRFWLVRAPALEAEGGGRADEVSRAGP